LRFSFEKTVFAKMTAQCSRKRRRRDGRQLHSKVRLVKCAHGDAERLDVPAGAQQLLLVGDFAENEVRMRIEFARKRLRCFNSGVNRLDCALSNGKIASGDNVEVSGVPLYLHERHVAELIHHETSYPAEFRKANAPEGSRTPNPSRLERVALPLSYGSTGSIRKTSEILVGPMLVNSEASLAPPQIGGCTFLLAWPVGKENSSEGCRKGKKRRRYGS
jgi:hypothetical protein